jgi:PAS domain S-box-containing protein
MSEQIAKRRGSNEEELLAALIASMADAVYAVDDAGVVLFANAAALSILGYGSESELIGRPQSRHHPPQLPRRSPVSRSRLPAAAPAPDRRGGTDRPGLVRPP